MKKSTFFRLLGFVLSLTLIFSFTGCDKMNQKTQITVASYNVQCLSYGTQLLAISEEIKTINPDIIGIQELDNYSNRTGNTNQLENLALMSGYKYFYFTKTIDHDGGEYGHGIMSKYPISNFETFAFKTQNNENRCFSRSEIDINGKIITFYNTHLEFGGNIQADQISEIFDLAQQDKYAIITGDMNCSPPAYKDRIKDKNLVSLNGGESFSNFINTCPEGEKSFEAIDNIIVSKSFHCYYNDKTKSNLIVNKTENSDHNMIYTHLEF